MNEKIFNSTIKYTQSFNSIIDFYLFSCPYENTSHRGKTFAEIGWKGSSRLGMLKRLLLSCDKFYKNDIVKYEENEINKIADSTVDFNYIFVKAQNINIKNIIKNIRNAFAHASFNIEYFNDKTIYYLENHYQGKILAKIKISEFCLLEWIKIIKTDPQHLTKKCKSKH